MIHSSRPVSLLSLIFPAVAKTAHAATDSIPSLYSGFSGWESGCLPRLARLSHFWLIAVRPQFGNRSLE